MKIESSLSFDLTVMLALAVYADAHCCYLAVVVLIALMFACAATKGKQ